MQFSDWLIKKYILWRGDKRGSESSQTAYARWLGVPQPLMSDWMKKDGTTPRTEKYISLLASKYPEIYEVLGIPAPKTQEQLEGLPPAMRSRIQYATAEVNHLLRERRLTGEDPEAEQLTIQIFEKWGFKYTSTDTLPDEDTPSPSK